MRIGYADPPYPGCAHLYADHPDYAGEVDHKKLLWELLCDYDGFALHTSSVALPEILGYLPDYGLTCQTADVRVMAWVKPFAAFKRNVSVAYAWEPVLVKAARKPVVKPGMTYRDWMAAPITLKRGLTGAKPDAVCRWLFEVMGCDRDDDLVDLFPGTGAVARAWDAWRSQGSLLAAGVGDPIGGGTADEQRARIMAAYEDGSGLAGQPPVRTARAAPGETEQTP